MVDPLSSEPVQNWNDLRAQLSWVYEGPILLNRTGPYCSGPYCATPIAAWLLHRGHVTLHFNDGKETYGSGSWIFPRGTDGIQEFSPDVTMLSVRFLAEWPTGESLFDRSKTRVIPAAKLPKLTRIGKRLAHLVGREFPGARSELPTRSGSLHSHFEMQRLLCGWMLAYVNAMEQQGLFPRTIGRLDPRIRQAIRILESRPLNQPMRERELAQKVGLCVSHFNKLFHTSLGKTPNEYWEHKKEHVARLTLLESRRTSKSIAYDLGFKSLSHFSLWVKRKFGQSPRGLRTADVAPKPRPARRSRTKK